MNTKTIVGKLNAELRGEILDRRGRKIRDFEGKGVLHLYGNGLTTVGFNDLLDKYFEGSSYTAAHYMGLVDNSGFSAFAVGDTMASHAGWAESADYAEANRPTISWSAAAAAAKASSGNIDYSMNATVTIKGVFVATDDTKSGASGVLWGTVAFSSNQALVSGQTLRISSYTISAAEA